MKKADICSKQSGVCFEIGKSLFQSRQASISKKAGASFKQHFTSKLILQTRFLENQENVSFRIGIY